MENINKISAFLFVFNFLLFILNMTVGNYWVAVLNGSTAAFAVAPPVLDKISEYRSTTKELSRSYTYEQRFENPEHIKLIHDTRAKEVEVFGEAKTLCLCASCEADKRQFAAKVSKAFEVKNPKSLNEHRRVVIEGYEFYLHSGIPALYEAYVEPYPKGGRFAKGYFRWIDNAGKKKGMVLLSGSHVSYVGAAAEMQVAEKFNQDCKPCDDSYNYDLSNKYSKAKWENDRLSQLYNKGIITANQMRAEQEEMRKRGKEWCS